MIIKLNYDNCRISFVKEKAYVKNQDALKIITNILVHLFLFFHIYFHKFI